ncbi:PglL family O-oligosaccharyltransferase [Zobellella maritima]|uniref:PglL family O-oligosaccharyltransferase n=1 Tax=Zobellella maritima TaxID=2059725 RepID=UPI000E3078C0|nr:Wzy polymerase domain-containing protein [Zobellella maritima]
MTRTALPQAWFWLFTAYLLFGMHFFMHNPGGSGFYLPFNMVGWIFVSLLIAVGLWQMTLNRAVRFSRFHALCWLVLGLLFVPLLYPNNEFADHALPRLAGAAGGLLLYFSLLQCRFDLVQRRRLLYLLLAGVSLEILLGLVQFYLLEPGNRMGYNTQVNRPYGIFQQPNVMASFVATGLMLACYLGVDDKQHHRNRACWLWLAAVLFTAPLLLMLLQSRTGQLAAVLGLLLLLPLAWQTDKKRLFIGLGLVLAGIVAALYSQSLNEGLQRGVESLANPGYRKGYWQQGLAMIQASPLFGYGYGDFERQFMEFYNASRVAEGRLPPMEPNLNHPHNELLFWGIEGGLLPVLGILLASIGAIGMLCNTHWRHSLALAALVWPIALHSQTEYPFYHSLIHWVTLLVLLYWIDSRLSSPLERPFHPWLLARFTAVLLPALVIPFMLSGLQTAHVVTRYERGGYQEPELLLSASNPMAWLTRLEFNAMSLQLAVGQAQQDVEALKAYVSWGEQFVRHTPRANIYYNLVLALNQLNEPARAKRLLAEARHFYPDEPLLKQDNISKALRSLDKGQSGQDADTTAMTSLPQP